VLFHSSRAISLKPYYFTFPELFQYNARLVPCIFQWADDAVY